MVLSNGDLSIVSSALEVSLSFLFVYVTYHNELRIEN